MHALWGKFCALVKPVKHKLLGNINSERASLEEFVLAEDILEALNSTAGLETSLLVQINQLEDLDIQTERALHSLINALDHFRVKAEHAADTLARSLCKPGD